MDATEIAKDEALKDLTTRMSATTDVKAKSAMVEEFAKKTYGTKTDERANPIMLSDEQLNKIVAGFDVKKIVEETTEHVERKYNFNKQESRAFAEDAVHTEIRRNERKQDDLAMAADVFRTMARAATGAAKVGELDAARERELKYLKDTGREVRAMSSGTGANGGYMAPETWNTYLYENLARVSFLRRYAKWMAMPEGNGGIMRLPKLTANVTSATVAENAAITGSQPTLSQATFTLKKLAVLSNPISMELLYEATPNIVQSMINWATVELNRKEDEVTFNTADGSWSGSYLLGSATNNVTMGTGKVNLTDVTFDDLNALVFQLAEQYVPDSDVQGSGAVTGEAQFWMNKSVIQQLLKLKGTDNGYLWDTINNLSNNKKIGGYNVRRTISMPSTATTGTKFAAFGNLGYMWVAYRPGFIIDIFNTGNVGGVSLTETGAYAVRVGEMLDIQRIDDNAFSILKTA